MLSEACERNKHPILEVLHAELADLSSVLEIGSGTGQHAHWFASHLPHLVWQPTELACHLADLREYLERMALERIRQPVALDVAQSPWPFVSPFDAIFTANTLHIMSRDSVESLFQNLPKVSRSGTRLCIYGPFNYGGKFTSQSNENFDHWLRHRDIHSGIRDMEWVNSLAETAGFHLLRDVEMPANNRLLVWCFRNLSV